VPVKRVRAESNVDPDDAYQEPGHPGDGSRLQPAHIERRARKPRISWQRWWVIVRLAAYYGFRWSGRNLLHWLSWALALGLELFLAVMLRGGEVFDWERDLTQLFQRAPGRFLVFDVANLLTNTLSLPFLILFVVVVAVVYALGFRLDAALLLLSFPLHVLVQFPKAFVDRPRPSSDFISIEGVGGLRSFPSGHAEFVVTFYGFLAFITIIRLDKRWQQVAVVASWLVLALAIGFGRVAMGRHWPLDILSSYLFGIGALSGLIWLRTSFLQAEATVDARERARRL